MKTKVEINGYEIAIEEVEGNITVKAQKDGETVEEFSLTPEFEGEAESPAATEPQGTEIKGFDQFGEEEEDFEEEIEGELEETPSAFGEEETESEYPESESEEETETEGELSEPEYSEGEESEDTEESETEEKEEVVESLKTFQSFINSKRV